MKDEESPKDESIVNQESTGIKSYCTKKKIMKNSEVKNRKRQRKSNNFNKIVRRRSKEGMCTCAGQGVIGLNYIITKLI